MDKRQIGTRYEFVAREYLEKEGYIILEMNFRSRIGEIDLIGIDGEYIAFVEVKYRTDSNKGTPLEAVDFFKQRKISNTADYYCTTHGLTEFYNYRFDVVSIENGEVSLLKNAFEYCGGR